MCMSFILEQVHAGYERGLRGVQRLLCTLLCTRSDSSEDLSQRCRRWASMFPKPVSFLGGTLVSSRPAGMGGKRPFGVHGTGGPRNGGTWTKGEIPRIFAPLLARFGWQQYKKPLYGVG